MPKQKRWLHSNWHGPVLIVSVAILWCVSIGCNDGLSRQVPANAPSESATAGSPTEETPGMGANADEPPDSRQSHSTAVAKPYELDNTLAVEERLYNAVKYLASDELEGRGPKTRGLDLAADYIAEQFRLAGLDTGRYGGTPFHEFRRSFEYTLQPGNEARVACGKSGPRTLTLSRDFTPIALSGSGQFDLPLVFAGYGITAAEHGYDDYAGIDVSGKAVVLLRHEPRQADPRSVFNGTRNSTHAYLSTKLENAAKHGAAAVVLCTTVHSLKRAAGGDLAEDRLLNFRVKGNSRRTIPVLHLRREVIDQLLADTEKESLSALETRIDADLKPCSFEMTDCRIEGNVVIGRKENTLKNVVGVLPGRGELANETIIVGAHYDHLGMGGSGSLAAWTREIHNGADDNASGTAALLETARQLASRQPESSRRIVFIAFSAEEMGLIGSEQYARRPLFSLDDTVAMINFDMIGRLAKDKLYVHGTGTAKEFDSLMTRLGEDYELDVKKRADGYGPSDHATFYGRGIPVLHFFTGLHKDYHRPSDDVERINVPGMQKITLMATNAVVELAGAKQRPSVNRQSGSLLGSMIGPDRSSTNRKAYLGVQVRALPDNRGVEITSVFRNSPAEVGQLRIGDVILKADGVKTVQTRDLIDIIKEKRVGDSLALHVLRTSIELAIDVDLTAR